MPRGNLITPDFKAEPYWWDGVAPADPGAARPPASADVAVVGSGYTGLNAALVIARAGRQCIVLDAEDAGWGCSSRNGGQIGTSIKPDLAELSRAHGGDKALAILKEGPAALAWIGDFVRAEKIDCNFKVAGRVHAAHRPSHYEQLARELGQTPKGLEDNAYMVPRAEQHGELGSDAYHGGAVYPRHASLDPARYHRDLLARIIASGAQVVPRCKVTGIERDGGGFRLATPNGALRCHDVLVATNGYTGAATPWQRRRVIPIGSYIIATEPLSSDLMDRLMPRGRVVSDSRKVVYYYRASPDRRRILFGGRVSAKETDPRRSAPKLHGELARILPELSRTRISHSWMGFIAYTFDTLAHLGRHDGIHYAMGYCGSGVAMASYLGQRIGQQLLGLDEGRTGFDGLAFKTRPLYFGAPWFLPAVVGYHRWRDRI